MRARSIIFWTLSLLTTLVFSLFMVTMLMVPGIMPGTKLWMLAVAGGCGHILRVWRMEVSRYRDPCRDLAPGPSDGCFVTPNAYVLLNVRLHVRHEDASLKRVSRRKLTVV
jgi:hypothetical protein